MSTPSQQPNQNQLNTNPIGQTNVERLNLPARRSSSPPAKREELSEEERQRLMQLFEQANLAHDLVEDAAIKFCRHSVDAGMALLEAQELCPKRTWGGWLADHFDGSARTAQRYMQQAKDMMLLGGSATDLSQNPSEELAQLFSVALKRLKRQRAAALAHNDASASIGTAEEAVTIVDTSDSSLSVNTDPFAAIIASFNELLSSLRKAIESGQRLDYGQFVLDELERIRSDVDACRLLLLCDAHALAAATA